ncbi:hypothetical protein ACL02T_10020 [Pseudonocardia sp. RS010]|uniref:hypothetical protein n=1 Tax=Pseudonocardia sp. RS010 TaxID=3385979 RepID=UPI0039A2F992
MRGAPALGAENELFAYIDGGGGEPVAQLADLGGGGLGELLGADQPVLEGGQLPFGT